MIKSAGKTLKIKEKWQKILDTILQPVMELNAE